MLAGFTGAKLEGPGGDKYTHMSNVFWWLNLVR